MDRGTQQLRALLAIKRTIDPKGSVLTTWVAPGSANSSADDTTGTGNGTGTGNANGNSNAFCSWHGVTCNADWDVESIWFDDVKSLTGRLPGGVLLQQLPALARLMFRTGRWGSLERGLDGTLPADWGQLAGLQELVLDDSNVEGTIPVEWGKMRSLRKLELRWVHESWAEAG